MKLQISLSESTRSPKGVELAAFEWATAQVNFDRNTRYSEILNVVRNSRLFTKQEIELPEFQQGVERAERQAKKENPRLRGIIQWTL